MQFWIRHIILIALCVVLPLGAALYFDTESEKDRAHQVGASTVSVASKGLESALSLEAHSQVGSALTLSQRIADLGIQRELSRGGTRGKEAFTRASELLGAVTPKNGFAWLVDADGRIVVRNGQAQPDEAPRSIVGHPVFAQTQAGNALDGVWDDDNGVTFVAAAPLVDEGAASGAVLIGRTVDRAMVERLAATVESAVSLIAGDQIIATSLDDGTARTIAVPATTTEPVHAGRRAEPLPHFNLPFLPLLIDPRAEGIAYTSAATPVRGAPPAVRWVVSVDSTSGLEGLAQRQEIIFAVLAASLLLALLVGLVNHRTFVRPISKLADHLSEIQLGRGELELPESRVSKPFRRLVRLINMTVQKVPTRTLSGIGSTSDVGLESRPVSRGSSLVVHPSQDLVPAEVPLPPPASSTQPLSMSTTPLPMEPPVESKPYAAPPSPPQQLEIPDDLMPDYEPSLPPPPPSGADDELDEAAAIAEAIASLESGRGLAAPPAPPPRDVRDPSAIRGRPMTEEAMPSPFAPSQSEFLRDGASLSGPNQDELSLPTNPPAPGVRTGGSLDLSGFAGVMPAGAAHVEGESFGPEATVVAPVAEDLLAKSARDDLTDHHHVIDGDEKPDMTVVASVPADLLAQSAGEAPIPDPPPPPSAENGLDAADRAHFQEVYERFLDMRRRCGEKTSDLAFDRFLKKLTKNRENLIKKYHCRTVRFQVYEKDGKAALKATPVRAR